MSCALTAQFYAERYPPIPRQVPALVYHRTTRRNRKSIEQHGLNPDFSEVWGCDNRIGNPYPFTWFWTDLRSAQESDYGEDIWEVEAQGIQFQADPHNPNWLNAVATQERVSVERIRLVQ